VAEGRLGRVAGRRQLNRGAGGTGQVRLAAAPTWRRWSGGRRSIGEGRGTYRYFRMFAILASGT